MSWSWFAVALLAAACGKSKGADVAQGSATGSESRTGSAPAAPTAPVTLPTVAGYGTDASTHPARVSVSPASITVDGKQVAGVAGVVDALSAPSNAPRFVLALDKTLDAKLLGELLTALKTQGLTQFGLLAQKAGAETVMLPFDLPPSPSVRSDLARQIEEVKAAGAQVKVGPSVGGRKEKDAPATPPSNDGPPNTVVVEVRDVSLSPESSLSTDIAKAKISATYLTGLRRCVKSFAEKDATTASSFSLTFSINETGMAVDAKATGVTNEAANCIATQAAAWRFPIPKDADRKGVKVNATAAFDISVDETTVRETNASMLPGESGRAPEPDTIGLTVTVTNDHIVVLSASSTVKAPATPIALASPDAAQQLSAHVEAFVKAGGDPKLAVHVIAVGATKLQRLAEVLGAVRATPAGSALLATVVLSID